MIKATSSVKTSKATMKTSGRDNPTGARAVSIMIETQNTTTTSIHDRNGIKTIKRDCRTKMTLTTPTIIIKRTKRLLIHIMIMMIMTIGMRKMTSRNAMTKTMITAAKTSKIKRATTSHRKPMKRSQLKLLVVDNSLSMWPRVAKMTLNQRRK
jgi:hypothetical protein